MKPFVYWLFPLGLVLVLVFLIMSGCYHGNPDWPTDPTQPPGPTPVQSMHHDAGIN